LDNIVFNIAKVLKHYHNNRIKKHKIMVSSGHRDKKSRQVSRARGASNASRAGLEGESGVHSVPRDRKKEEGRPGASRMARRARDVVQSGGEYTGDNMTRKQWEAGRTGVGQVVLVGPAYGIQSRETSRWSRGRGGAQTREGTSRWSCIVESEYSHAKGTRQEGSLGNGRQAP
jgi:hypothetical protein